MRIGTAEAGSTFLTQGLALKIVLERAGVSGAIAILESQSASIENAERLERGDLDFGFMAANWIGRARASTEPFTTACDLRVVSPMNLGPMFLIARADSSLRSVADCAGKSVAVGPATSGIAQHARAIFGALDIAIRPVHLDFASGGEALTRGAIDAQLQCPIPNQVMSRLDAATDLRVLPYAPGELERVLAAHPTYRRATLRKGALRALDDDVAQPGVVNVLVTHARQPPAQVEALVRAIVAHAGDLARRNPLFTGLADLWEPLRTRGAAALEFEGVPLHAGAAAAYQRMGLLT